MSATYHTGSELADVRATAVMQLHMDTVLVEQERALDFLETATAETVRS